MKSRLAIAAASLLVAGLLAAAITAAPSANMSVRLETEPSSEPTIVTGTVYDSGGSPVIGAEVNVSMYDGETLRSYLEDVTDSLGQYLVTFNPQGGEPWGVGDTIQIVAEHDGYFGTNSTTAHDIDDPGPLQYVNVTLLTVIPEFGGLGSLVPIAGVLSIFMAFFFARRERNP